MNEAHVQRNYKDTMFRMLFKENIISGSRRTGSGLLYQERDTGGFPVKESGGGDSSEYI